MWVIYNIWKWTSLGIMWTAHGNFFINGGSRERNKVLNSFRITYNAFGTTNMDGL